MNKEFSIGLLAVLDAGKAIFDIYNTDFDVKMKAENDPVTEADLSAHRIVLKYIKDFFPGDILLSEEDIPPLDKRLSNKRVWILDPLDGTRDFVKKNPEFAVSLGLSIDNCPVLGIIFNPITGEIFYGSENNGMGIGTWMLDSLTNSQLTESRLNEFIKSTSHQNPYKEKQIIYVSNTEKKENLYFPLEESKEFRSNFIIESKGSIAYKLGLLARGDCDLVISLKPKNEWDICGGIGILKALDYSCFEIYTEKKYSFNREDTKTLGLIAGKKELVDKFWRENKSFLQNSLRKWDGTKI